MLNKLKLLAVMLVTTLSLGVFAATPALADSHDADLVPKDDAVSQVLKGVDDTGTSTLNVTDVVGTITDILSWVIGVIAVIMIIVSGLKFVTSGGDAGKVTSARNGIIYAIVGLVVVVMAQVLVKFVFTSLTS